LKFTRTFESQNLSFQTAGNTSATDSVNFTVGHNANAQLFNGDISELIFYNVDKSADTSNIETNIKDYYSI
jgi:hypothetical protein